LKRPPRRWPRRSWRLDIPGDFSLGAYFLAAGLLADRGQLVVEGVGVNPMRTGLLAVLRRMGADVDRLQTRGVGEEPVADLVARPSRLTAVEVGAEETAGLADEIPLLAVLASRAEGTSVIREVGDLRVRDHDRPGHLARTLRGLGIEAEVRNGELHVQGSDRPPSGRVDTAGDARVAMAFAVLARAAGASIELAETVSVNATYPSFFMELDRVVTHD
jgi:3-phosphoshikimate 1-carboxyvinyltransferase